MKKPILFVLCFLLIAIGLMSAEERVERDERVHSLVIQLSTAELNLNLSRLLWSNKVEAAKQALDMSLAYEVGNLWRFRELIPEHQQEQASFIFSNSVPALLRFKTSDSFQKIPLPQRAKIDEYLKSMTNDPGRAQQAN